MSVVSCEKMDITNIEQFELRQRHGYGFFERMRIVTSGEDVNANDIAQSGCLPKITRAEPDPDRNALLKQVELIRLSRGPEWNALLWWIPVTHPMETRS